MRSSTVPSSLPPMYGVSPGHSATATGHAALTATIATPASASWPSRLPSAGGPARTYAAPSAGAIIHPCSILVMNARPTSAPQNNRCFVLPDSSARTRKYAAATISRTSSASGLFTRAMATVIGVSASIPAAIRPAGAPKTRRTVA